MKKKVGFIGSGNMAQAMIGGIINSKLISKDNIMISDPSEHRLSIVKEKFEVETTVSNVEIVKFAEVLILAIKPYLYGLVIEEIKNFVKEDAVIIAIAAGISIEFMEKAFNKKVKIVRSMPNTPAMVGAGMSAICVNQYIEKEELDMVVKIFESFGKAEVIEEKFMDMIPSISSSSPAYVYMFIEALADGAVLRGLPRSKAYKMAAQAVIGAAKMVLETKKHPGALKDDVCSPGGTTIEAVFSLEKNNFRGTVIEAMEKCTEKTIKMSREK